MDSQRFDDLVRDLTASRRSLLGSGMGVVTGWLGTLWLPGIAAGQKETQEEKDETFTGIAPGRDRIRTATTAPAATMAAAARAAVVAPITFARVGPASVLSRQQPPVPTRPVAPLLPTSVASCHLPVS